MKISERGLKLSLLFSVTYSYSYELTNLIILFYFLSIPNKISPTYFFHASFHEHLNLYASLTTLSF